MAWRDVMKLLEFAGGNIGNVDRDKLKSALSAGRGTPDVQLRIAEAMYKRKYKRKEAKDYG